jgi:peptidoglycan hydrolase-like protein with peptidoglycan-binding domain
MAVTLSHAEVSNSASQTKASASPTSHHSAKSKHKKSRKTARRRGQQKIDSQRARQIQEALIREHYLTGKPSGVWDTATQAAMQKYQADNGWQTKTTPDSRALIKLGLGPDQEHLLNPESAMTSQPHPHAAPASASSKTTDPPSSPQPQK